MNIHELAKGACEMYGDGLGSAKEIENEVLDTSSVFVKVNLVVAGKPPNRNELAIVRLRSVARRLSGRNVERMASYYAHSVKGRSRAEWEPLERHLQLVATGEGAFPGAAGFAAAFGAGEWGSLAGWWHDLGKYSDAFQAYISRATDSSGDEHVADVAGRVDHSTAGAKHAASRGMLGILLSYCIAGHHAGLPDNVGTESSLSSRLSKRVPNWTAAPVELLDRPMPAIPRLRPPHDHRLAGFSLAFFVRMLFSCLVDADFLATEQFMDAERGAQRPSDEPTMDELLRRLDAHLAGKERTDTELNRHRQEILCECRGKAAQPPGLFSLEVPTGGGKTLSSLAFALTHAAKNKLCRVVYAIPFTSIIEQTTNVFREAMGDLAESILEHHSNLEPGDPIRQSTRSRLAAENWDAPIVVTTNVQIFESLFASRTSRCRKLHRLAKSVIILDEAQTLPINLLFPALAALDELVRNYGATVVLCTATQPALERREGFPIGLEKPTPIIDAPLALHGALKRTRIEHAGLLTNDQIVDRVRGEQRVLCIVNSRRHASELFESLSDETAYHLSASMCAAHRSDMVKAIRDRLSSNGECRVISTQVIEAGVDLDFPVVFRAAAGLDSVAQAAGRCNREGRLADATGQPALGRVIIFDYDEKANRPPPIARIAAVHFREVAPDHAEDLLSPKAIEAYFRLHYWHSGREDGRGWDEGREGKSVMDRFKWEPGSGLHAQFREAAERFQLIEDVQTPILVPYGERGQSLIAELQSAPETPEPKWLRGFDRRAQRYIVGIHENILRKLLDQGVLLERHDRYYLGNPEAYDGKLGLTFRASGLGTHMTIV